MSFNNVHINTVFIKVISFDVKSTQQNLKMKCPFTDMKRQKLEIFPLEINSTAYALFNDNKIKALCKLESKL